MQLKNINIDGFGVWNGLSVEDLSPEVTVLFGRNEAGKSTLLHFLRAMLYGRDEEEERKYLPPVNGGQPGGSLQIRGTLGHFRLFRQWNHIGTEEHSWIESSDGTRQSRSQLDALLEGVDRNIYNNIFAVGLREMQLLATLDDSDAARKIYELTSGLDRISLSEVVRVLDASQDALITADGSDCIVHQLIEQHKGLEKEVRELQGNTQKWTAHLNQFQTIEQQIEQFNQRVTTIESKIQFVELAEQVRDSIKQRNSLEKEIDRFGELPEVTQENLDLLNQLRERVSRKKARCTELRADYKRLYSEHNAIPLNRELARHRARVDALGEQRQWILSLKNSISLIDDEIKEAEQAVDMAWRQTGLRAENGHEPDISTKELKSLKEPLLTLEHETEALENAKRQVLRQEEELSGVENEVERSLSAYEDQDLSKAIEKASEHVNLLRRRIQLEEKIEKLDIQFKETEGDSHDILIEQLEPRGQYLLAAFAFGLGVILILIGLNEFLGDIFQVGTNFGAIATIFGVLALGTSYTIKQMFDHSKSEELEDCKRQLKLLDTQLDKAEKEREELDYDLPTGNGPWISRLKEAEEHLNHLEELIPLGTKLGEVRQAKDKNSQRIGDAELALANAKRKWRSSLQSLGLPSDSTPESIKQLARQLSQIAKLKKSIKTNRELKDQRHVELESLLQRVRQLAQDIGMIKLLEDPIELLNSVEEELTKQGENAEHRVELRSKAKKIRDEYKKNALDARKGLKQRQEILDQVSVASEHEYRELLEKTNELARLQNQFASTLESMLGRVEEPSDLQQLEDFVIEHTVLQAEEILSDLMNDHEQAEKRSKEFYERRGEIKAQLELLENNDRLMQAQLELSEVEKQLTDAISRWQSLAVSNYILDQIRQIYETERQPETLKLASSYLIKLTSGKYTRVWTPLSENTLYVENREGVSKSLINLSEGTREQVFLAVRLSLIRAFARQGRILPVILDDVLVNFDMGRSQASAELFAQFAAEGHQLLVFTCHEHILAMFQELGCDVRTLPQVTGACRPGDLNVDLAIPQIELEEEEEVEEYYEDEVELEDDATEEEEYEEYEELEEEEYEEEPEEEEEYELAEAEEIEELDYEYEEEDEEEVEVVELEDDYNLKAEDLPEIEVITPVVEEEYRNDQPLDLWDISLEVVSTDPQPVIMQEINAWETVVLPVEYRLPKLKKIEPITIELEPEEKPVEEIKRINAEREFGWDSPRRWYEEVDPRKESDQEKVA